MSETAMAMVARGFGFNGCTGRDPYTCECYTWAPTECPICEEKILDGQEIIQTVRDLPYLMEDDPEQQYDFDIWHKACDPGTIAAANAEELP